MLLPENETKPMTECNHFDEDELRRITAVCHEEGVDPGDVAVVPNKDGDDYDLRNRWQVAEDKATAAEFVSKALRSDSFGEKLPPSEVADMSFVEMVAEFQKQTNY